MAAPARPGAPTRSHWLAAVVASLLVAMSAQAEPQTFVLDPASTHAHFELMHFGTSTIRGRFSAIDGSITLDRAARSGRADMSVATAAVSTGFVPFDGIIRGPYLLDTTQYPTAYFVAQQFTFDGERLASVSGEFTLRGVGRTLVLKALRFSCRTEPEPKPKPDTEPAREICGGDFEGEFRRSAFGITHSLPFVADRVRLQVQVEASRPIP